jgi:hypothetical protein
MERGLQTSHAMKTTTLGELVSELVDQYERLYHDHELAAVATSVTLDDILHDHEERKQRPVRERARKRRR